MIQNSRPFIFIVIIFFVFLFSSPLSLSFSEELSPHIFFHPFVLRPVVRSVMWLAFWLLLLLLAAAAAADRPESLELVSAHESPTGGSRV